MNWRQAFAGALLLLSIACFYLGWRAIVKHMKNGGEDEKEIDANEG